MKPKLPLDLQAALATKTDTMADGLSLTELYRADRNLRARSMDERKIRPRTLLILLSLCMLICGCKQQRAEPLVIGINPWPGYEAVHLAENLGLFKREGLNVKIVDFASLGDARRAFERGQLDVVGSTVVELLVSRERSPRTAMAIYAVDYSNGSDVLLARPEIKSVEELRGKKIAAEPGAVDIFALHLALRKYGLKLSDVQLIPLSLLEAEDAYLRGEVDAVQCYPPVAIDIMKHGARPLFDSSQVPEQIVDILFADKTVIASRKAELHKFLAIFAKAQQMAILNEHGERSIMAKREGLSLSEFEAAFRGLVILGKENQENYLQQDRKLQKILAEVREVLRQAEHLKQDIELSNIISQMALEQS